MVIPRSHPRENVKSLYILNFNYLLILVQNNKRCTVRSIKIIETQRAKIYINYKKKLFVIKPTRCIKFTNLFWHEIIHVSDSFSAHHQEFIHCTGSGPARQLCTDPHDIYYRCVYSE